MWKFYNSLTSRSSQGALELDKEIFYKYCLVSVSLSTLKVDCYSFSCRDSGLKDCISSSRATCSLKRRREYPSKSSCLYNVSNLRLLIFTDVILIEKYCRASTESIDRMIFDIFDLSGNNLISEQELSQMLLTMPE